MNDTARLAVLRLLTSSLRNRAAVTAVAAGLLALVARHGSDPTISTDLIEGLLIGTGKNPA
jgi:hypothetical protein